MIKIAIISKFSPYKGYGVEEVVRQNLECLSNNFKSIIVVFYYTYEKEKIEIKKIGLSTVILRPIKVPKIKILDRIIYNLIVGLLTINKNYSIIHTHGETGFGCFIFKKLILFKSKFIWFHTAHGLWFRVMYLRIKVIKNPIKKIILKFVRNIWNLFEKYSVKGSDITIAVSDGVKHDIEQIFNLKKDIIVIPNSFNDKVFKKINKQDSCKLLGLNYNYKYLLYIGTDLHNKGFDIALKIIEELSKIDNNIKLIALVGNKKVNIDEKIKNKVILFNRVPSEKMPYIYSVADVFIFTSRYDSFGIAGLEAMACETPVVFSNNVGIAKMLDKEKIPILPLNNIDLWIKTIQRILNDEQYRANIIEYEKTVVKKFTQKNICKKLVDLYKKYLL